MVLVGSSAMSTRAVRVVARRHWESVVTETLFSLAVVGGENLVERLVQSSRFIRDHEDLRAIHQRSSRRFKEHAQLLHTNIIHVWGVEWRLRKTSWRPGVRCVTPIDGTENETMRGDVPVQGDGSGSKIHAGTSVSAGGSDLPKPHFQGSEDIVCGPTVEVPVQTGGPYLLGSMSDKTRSFARGTTKMTETVRGILSPPLEPSLLCDGSCG
jgi:hypothetical protein